MRRPPASYDRTRLCAPTPRISPTLSGSMSGREPITRRSRAENDTGRGSIAYEYGKGQERPICAFRTLVVLLILSSSSSSVRWANVELLASPSPICFVVAKKSWHSLLPSRPLMLEIRDRMHRRDERMPHGLLLPCPIIRAARRSSTGDGIARSRVGHIDIGLSERSRKAELLYPTRARSRTRSPLPLEPPDRPTGLLC